MNKLVQVIVWFHIVLHCSSFMLSLLTCTDEKVKTLNVLSYIYHCWADRCSVE